MHSGFYIPWEDELDPSTQLLLPNEGQILRLPDGLIGDNTNEKKYLDYVSEINKTQKQANRVIVGPGKKWSVLVYSGGYISFPAYRPNNAAMVYTPFITPVSGVSYHYVTGVLPELGVFVTPIDLHQGRALTLIYESM